MTVIMKIIEIIKYAKIQDMFNDIIKYAKYFKNANK